MNPTPVTSSNTSTASVPAASKPARRRLAAVAAGLAMAFIAFLAVPGQSGIAVAAGADMDGRIVSGRGSSATVTLGCSGVNVIIDVDNQGFDWMSIYVYDASTGTGGWTDWSPIGDNNYHGLDWRKPNTSRSYALFFAFYDGSYAGEFVPFTSGAYNARTGIFCGPNGAHD